MRALIIGAGAAGTAAAVAMRKAGWDADVFEAYEHSSGLSEGEYLTVAVNGLDALRAVDAHHAVTDHGFPTPRAEFFSGTGKKLGSVPLGPTLEDGTTTHTILRPALYGALYDLALKRGARITHGKKLAAYAEDANGDTAVFEDGTEERGDVLVGADGIHSVTRTLLDPNATEPYYAGSGNSGGYATMPELDAPVGVYRMVWGKECFFGYIGAPDGRVWWFANPPAPRAITRDEVRMQTSAGIKRELIELLRADKTPGAEIVAATENEPRIWSQFLMHEVAIWHSDRVVIIGDAAHAVSPASGQGTSMGFEDAVTLAKMLRDRPRVSDALAAYDLSRRERVRAIVAYGSNMSNTKKQGALSRAIRDVVLPTLLKKGSTPAAMQKNAWLFDHHIDWHTHARH